MQGFPKHAIGVVCCTVDSGELFLAPDWEADDCGDGVGNGLLQCNKCGSSYPVSEGVLDLLDISALDAESLHELRIRANQYASPPDESELARWQNDETERMEIDATIDALSADTSLAILELGCGDGRLTTSLVTRFRTILAVDFSLEALRRLQRLIAGRANVALVHADVSTMKVRPGSFDRVLSTLTSNLPTNEHREAMYRLAAQALSQDGRFVFSTHNHGFWQHIHRKKKSDRYQEGGIFRHNMTPRECRAEARRNFRAVKAWAVQISLPFSRRLGLPAYPVSRALERVPPFGYFGRIVVCAAEKPLKKNYPA